MVTIVKPQQYRSLQLSLLSISSSDYHSLCTSSSRIPLLSAATTSTTFTVTCAGAATIHDQPTTHHIPARVATTTTSESEHSKLYKASGRIMDKSPFDKLPLELRLDIYERVLHVEDGLRITLDNKPSKYQRSHTKNADRRPTRSSSLQKNLLAIRATCKEVYLETDGIVSSVNNSWTFVHCEDNTTAWGKRARRWLLLAGPEAQRRVRSVQFDLGVWTKQQRNIHSRADDAPREAIAMWSYLPKRLKQRSIDCSIKLTVDWTSGMRLPGAGRAAFGPCVYKIPMWRSRKEVQDAIKQSTHLQQQRALVHARAWRDSWAWGDGDTPAFKSPPRFNRWGPQLYREVDDLYEMSCALARACSYRLGDTKVRFVSSKGCLQLSTSSM
jgi:hypothetical protein